MAAGPQVNTRQRCSPAGVFRVGLPYADPRVPGGGLWSGVCTL